LIDEEENNSLIMRRRTLERVLDGERSGLGKLWMEGDDGGRSR
jgi:hypothetical protein